MRRLIALVWLALSLAMSSGPAFAMQTADCPMAASSMPMHHDHDRNCCKPACAPNCALACPNLVAPSADGALARMEPIGPQHAIGLVAPLSSFDLSGADPPPRTIIS